ncbi:MAG TPA: hypothetical protein VLE23_02910 [Geminicoccaceae bacterium]|nr:hypothetical protein [Geminicoccaceae bacterium]
MAATPFEQDQPTPSRIQRVMMAAMRRPQVGFGLADRGRGGKDPKSPDLLALALDRVSLTVDDGVLMALGPEGDPIPPADFVAAAAAQPDATVAWSGGETVSAGKAAAVLEAQTRGPLGSEQGDQNRGEAWIKAMLGLGPQPAMASEAELHGERGACELTAFGRELMITMPSGRSFLVADAAPAHRAEATVGLTLAEGQAVSVGDLVARLRAHVEQTQGTAGGGPASAEVALPGCAVQGADDGLTLQLPSVGVVRLAKLGDGAAPGPRVSIFRTNGEAAEMADMVAELGPAPVPPPAAVGGREEATLSSPPPASMAAGGGTGHRDGAAPPMAAPVPLIVSLPGVAGDDAERVAVVVIGGLPQNAVLSSGIDNGDGSWMLSPLDLSGLALTAPAARSEDIVLTVTAFVVENREGELAAVSGTIRLPFDAGAPIALAIDPAVLRAGGPGLNALVIRDLPEGARLSAGTYDPAIGGWVLLPRQLEGLTLTPPAGQAAFTLSVLGISLGAGGSGQAKVLTRLPIAPH